jgi:hypothetical protein
MKALRFNLRSGFRTVIAAEKMGLLLLVDLLDRLTKGE